MSGFRSLLLVCLWSQAAAVNAETWSDRVRPLIDSACMGCHADETQTGLDLKSIRYDLSAPGAFRRWERIYDRIHNGEMPPASEPRPDPQQRQRALDALQGHLRSISRARQQRIGRVPARRLTKREYKYTMHDLLQIAGDVSGEIPDDVESGSFDTVGAVQRISAVHLQSYLKAADAALDLAIQLGRRPYRNQELDFVNNAFLNAFHRKPLNLGGNVSRRLDDGVALFRDVDYLIASPIAGFQVRTPGVYRITSKVAAFQSKTPVTLKLIRKQPSGGAKLLQTHDLVPGKPETIVVTTYMNPGDGFYTTFETESEPFAAIMAAGGSQNYKGPGIAIKAQAVAGPLSESWPPDSTRQLLPGLKLTDTRGAGKGPYRVDVTKQPIVHVEEVVRRFAPRVFRRPPADGELQPFIELARPAIAADRDLVDVLRIPLRALLSSPQFLMFAGAPGVLDDYALANRLSFFLWKSMPDEELFALAEAGKLSDPKVLATQVDRLLDDQKAQRFVRDFLGQWLRLYQVNATTPDEKLYPEYDELLNDAIPREPELFFGELIAQNLSIRNVVDSDFTFVNRRLAEHYRIPGVIGQDFRRIDVPSDSPRGGMLTQAAVLKTTANGTVISPVTRGNFVLTSILGTPPSPPPPDIGSIEPDTRGQTTIREILAAHREIDSCQTCHSVIDPPGFALESFDPIGGFRTRYRANAGGGSFPAFLGGGQTYKSGPPVDASGETQDGRKFSGIREFKQLLLEGKQQIAGHFISQLVVYATGGEIQFADRQELQTILNKTRPDDFRVRDIIHAVVQSPIFRNK